MWFTENPWPPMLIACFGALICFGLWNADRRNLYFFLAMAFLGMTGGIYAVERVIVTEGERLQDDVAMLCHQFQHRDPKTLDHFSDTAPEWKTLVSETMKVVTIQDDLRLTDFQTIVTNEHSRATVHFRANATISAMGFNGHHPFRCIFSFQKEGGQWKIIDVQRLDPIKGDPIEIMEPR